jgi:hypothetical protein
MVISISGFHPLGIVDFLKKKESLQTVPLPKPFPNKELPYDQL